MKIDNIDLKIIQDSREEDTLEVTMKSNSFSATSSIPQGKSRGIREVALLPASQALRNFQSIKNKITNKEFSALQDFDDYLIHLDGTANKSNLGGNLILVLSQTFARLMAKIEKVELWQYLQRELSLRDPIISEEREIVQKSPYFCFNIINGGEHAPYGPKIQEYWIVPQVSDPQKSLTLGKKFFASLKEYFREHFGGNQFGDEGGLLLNNDNYQEPLKILTKVRAQLKMEDKIRFSLDEAASSFYHPESKKYFLEEERKLSPQEMMEVNKKIIQQYDILSLEDPFEENDWQSFRQLTKETQGKVIIVGDDLTVTNPQLVEKAGKTKTISGVIIKPTQIGSVSETLQTIALAHKYNLKIVVSHRSGETMDDFIADLAWASRAWGLKSGAPQPPERMVKYNRIVEIYNKLS